MNAKEIKVQKGTVFIEMALFFPILILLGFYGFELARLYYFYETLSSISREAAREASRRCSTSLDQTSCITNEVFPIISAFASSTLPGSEIVLSLYKLDPPSSTTLVEAATAGLIVSTDASGRQVRATPTNGANTRYTLEKIQEDLISSTVRSLSPEKPTVAISEVFYPYDTIIPKSFLVGLKSGIIYETTIF
jgi:Flp pilus assembly protein TadG